MEQQLEEFESTWNQLIWQACREIYNDARIQPLKDDFATQGFLTLEQKSLFIDLADEMKYKQIYQAFGPEGSSGYERFKHLWQEWFKAKGHIHPPADDASAQGIVNHLLFGSTPEPESFLTYFKP